MIHLTSPFLHTRRQGASRRCGMCLLSPSVRFFYFCKSLFLIAGCAPKVTVQPRDHTLAPFVSQPKGRIVPTLRARHPSFVPQTRIPLHRLSGTVAARNPFPQSDTFLHRPDVLRVEHPTVRAVLRTTPNQFVHLNNELHNVLDLAQGAKSVGGWALVIIQRQLQPQRV